MPRIDIIREAEISIFSDIHSLASICIADDLDFVLNTTVSLFALL